MQKTALARPSTGLSSPSAFSPGLSAGSLSSMRWTRPRRHRFPLSPSFLLGPLSARRPDQRPAFDSADSSFSGAIGCANKRASERKASSKKRALILELFSSQGENERARFVPLGKFSSLLWIRAHQRPGERRKRGRHVETSEGCFHSSALLSRADNGEGGNERVSRASLKGGRKLRKVEMKNFFCTLNTSPLPPS